MTIGRAARQCARLGTLSLLFIAVLVPGCTPASSDPEPGSSITILTGDGERWSMFRGQSKYLLFLPLVGFEDLEVIPRLAQSWEHSPDHRTWTFHLRDDVRWHDGVPVTAHDVVFSMKLFSHPEVLFSFAAYLATQLDSIWAADDYTLVVRMRRPTSPPPMGVPFRGWTIFFPRHVLEGLDPADFARWDFWARPVGNGPYRFVRRVPQTMFELAANPDFYAGEPSIQKAVVRFGGGTPWVELASDRADVALFVTPNQELKLDTDDRFVIYHEYDWSELLAIHWNQRHPLLADARVRRALTHAIDRRELARILNYPEEMPLVGGISNEDLGDHPYRTDGWDQGPAHEPERAARLLEQAGWVDRDGDGIRERGQGEARFTLVVHGGGYYRGEEQGLFIQDQLRRVGVAVELKSMEAAAVHDAHRFGEFDAIINWVDNTPDGILVDWLGEPHPDSIEAWEGKPFGYFSTEVARLLRVLHRERDLDVQDTLYRRVNQILRHDMPVTFLFPVVGSHVAHHRIRGLRSGGTLLQFPEELRIEEEP